MIYATRGTRHDRTASGTVHTTTHPKSWIMGALLGSTILISNSAWAAPPLTALPSQAHQNAQTANGPRLVRKADVESGSLLIETNQPGVYVTAPLVAGHVDMDIAGPVIRTTLTQRFTNPTQDWVEGVYVFPLPETAAVDTLKVIIGDRFIEGQIKERAEARQIYEEAKASGVRAGLVEQERPNMFTTSVANIGPGETVAIQIEYQDKPLNVDGQWTTRFPMIVAPRYIPQDQQIELAALGSPSEVFSASVPDAKRITPPVMHPANEASEFGLRLPMSFDIHLDAGFDIGSVSSSSHALIVELEDEDTAHISLKGKEVPANQDFVLQWSASRQEEPQAELFSQTVGSDTYVMAFLTPPDLTYTGTELADRETIFVIDNSGSMAGESMRQAKTGLLIALDRLNATDEFNIVRFDDTYDMVFSNAVPATPENISLAKRYVANLQADGGTEMLPALNMALRDYEPENTAELRQIVFITDGAIGNENELFEAIRNKLGRSRLFTIGIGSAPNSHFMTRAARMGRGSFTYINDISQVAQQSSRLFKALESPVMTDLNVKLPDGMIMEAYPDPLPDLYSGEPVTLIARTKDLDGTLEVSGKFRNSNWTQTLSLAEAKPATGLFQLWGRAKIADIEESLFDGASYSDVDAGVLKTALDFNLVSRLTSLVAVDVTPARPAGVPIDTRNIATMLPKGWDFAAVFGEAQNHHALATDKLPPEILSAIAARNTHSPEDTGLDLPRTALNWQSFLLLGVGLMFLGLVAGRRRKTS